ncbi:MAG: 3-oxoacyl-[acyl-carrier-protein] reductase [Candidatus Omnitrophica bacterium]|nr:3-oxoacyl-[acyl-carrier-protein] reductase [Candidatus Omnitrophota bacterium]
MQLRNKIAIISGATRGIGRAIAIELAKAGANISFNYLKSSQNAIELEEQVKSFGVKARSFQSDIRDFESVKNWVEESREFFGTIDIVINNAGIIKDKALALMDISDWTDVINTNLTGAFNLTRAAVITLLKQKSGSIINISSVSGIRGIPRQTNYSASKAGLIGFTKSLAQECAGYNVRVNAVAPGFIETDMLSDLRQDYKEKILKFIPLGRMGRAEEVAKAVKFLASESSNYITGQTIVVDGGMAIV